MVMDRRAATNDMLFDAVCDLLQKWHRKKPHHTPLDTINRLFKKHLKGKPEIAANPPWLTSRNTLVTQETRSTQDLAKLADPVGGARDCEHPIVIVRYRGLDCLLDGYHRSRAGLASTDMSEHTAYVLIVQQPS
jgi:hypothetical protein